MSQIIPYLLPLMLGRTIDLNKMRMGVDIFPKEVITNTMIYNFPMSESHSGVLESAHKARSLLNIGNAMSLRVKAGIVSAGASGEYLSDYFHRGHTAEMVIKATYQTVTEFLSDDAKPIPSWQEYGDALGTHYVHGITYGGEIIASIRYKTNNSIDKQKIEKTISQYVYKLGDKVEDESVREILKYIESTEIKIFSSVPLTKLPKDMHSLKQILEEGFLRDFKQFNGGRGVPFRIELRPLAKFDVTREDKPENRDLDLHLEHFENMFDDLRETKIAISDWIKNMVTPLTAEQEQKVGDLYYSLEQALKVFYEVIGALDTSQGSDQLKKAEDAYGKDGFRWSYYRKYRRLRQEMVKDEKEEAKETTSIVEHIRAIDII